MQEAKITVLTSSNRIFAVSTWSWSVYLKLLKENKSFQ